MIFADDQERWVSMLVGHYRRLEDEEEGARVSVAKKGCRERECFIEREKSIVCFKEETSDFKEGVTFALDPTTSHKSDPPTEDAKQASQDGSPSREPLQEDVATPGWVASFTAIDLLNRAKTVSFGKDTRGWDEESFRVSQKVPNILSNPNKSIAEIKYFRLMVIWVDGCRRLCKDKYPKCALFYEDNNSLALDHPNLLPWLMQKGFLPSSKSFKPLWLPPRVPSEVMTRIEWKEKGKKLFHEKLYKQVCCGCCCSRSP